MTSAGQDDVVCTQDRCLVLGPRSFRLLSLEPVRVGLCTSGAQNSWRLILGAHRFRVLKLGTAKTAHHISLESHALSWKARFAQSECLPWWQKRLHPGKRFPLPDGKFVLQSHVHLLHITNLFLYMLVASCYTLHALFFCCRFGLDLKVHNSPLLYSATWDMSIFTIYLLTAIWVRHVSRQYICPWSCTLPAEFLV
jgi:hypothetical protein